MIRVSDHKFLKEWKKKQTELILSVHPDWDVDKIKDELNKIIDERLKNPECALHNNYLNKTARSTLLDIYDFIDKTNPIMAGGGVLFRNQHEALNPPSIFLDGSMKKRKAIKKKLKLYKPGSYEYQVADRGQLTEKVVANSYYGASGNTTSPFYNLYTALATTATGQSLISTMMCSFESFYANNVKLYDISSVILYISNSLRKTVDYEVEIEDMPEITEEKLLDKLVSMFKDDKKAKMLSDNIGMNIIKETIHNLTKADLQIVYYSSNFFEFIKIPSVHKLITNMICSTESFKDPNAVPEDIKEYLDQFWHILQYWVVYNHPFFNRINRLKFEQRKTVVTIDTDSNMLNIDKWMKFVKNEIDTKKAKTQDPSALMYIACNSLCYILTKYTQIILATYCKIAHIPDDYAPRLNMKNEYLFRRMALTKNKKSYTGLIRLREGNEILPEKIEIKGLMLMKSIAAPETATFFKKVIKDDILYADPISATTVLKKTKDFAKYIENSLRAGEKKFLSPLSVKEPEAYDKPFSNQGVRGTFVWNLCYPDMEITLPDKVTIVKVHMETLEKIHELQIKEPKIYKALMDGVFNNELCTFRDKGINVIAIPSTIDKVPAWVSSYIETDKIISDNISKIYPIFGSLGLPTLDTRSNEPHFTNIIQF